MFSMILSRTVFSVLLSFWIQGLLFAQQAPSFYAPLSVHDVQVTFESAEWGKILDSLKGLKSEHRLLATVVVNGKKFPNSGIRYKGNSSYHSVRKEGEEKLPFNIKLDYKVKTAVLPGGYKTLKLGNFFRDPSLVREAMAYEISARYLPSPKANFTKLTVNKQYLGLYSNAQSVDKLFLKSWFGDNSGFLVKCDPPSLDSKAPSNCREGDRSSLQYLGEDTLCYLHYYEPESNGAVPHLMLLTKALEESQGVLDSLLDVDQVLWMHAFNNVTVNLDSYSGLFCHNYYLYKDKWGIWHPILWDMNLCFGGFRLDGVNQGSLSLQQMIELSPNLHHQDPKRPLISKLMAQPSYKKLYLAHIRTLVQEEFSNGKFAVDIQKMQAKLDPLLKGDAGNLYSYQDFLLNDSTTAKAGKVDIVGLLELMDARSAFLLKHPLIDPTRAPVIQGAKMLPRPPKKPAAPVTLQAQVSAATKVWALVQAPGTSIWQWIPMKDDGTAGDPSANDGSYTLTLDKKQIAKYYIFAEGELTGACYPARASAAPLLVK